MAATTAIQGIPFAPGRAHGPVLRDPVRATGNDVLLISQAQLVDARVRPAAFVVAGGAPFSHPMIRLLAFGVPVVIISPAEVGTLSEGADVAVDGFSGRIVAADSDMALPATLPPVPRPGSPVLSADAQPVALCASVADATGAARALRQGAAAIGLVRSEFIEPASGERPDAAFYLTVFRELCQAAYPLPVTVRLLDIAADKRPAWLAPVAGMQGALGLQGIRLYAVDAVREVVNAQLEAISRLAPEFELSLLLPYVVRVEEFGRWRTEIERGLPAPLAIGSMIETPAAALNIVEILAQADFVALGCNDLMQCLFAADRDIPEVAPLLDPYAPVLYRFLGQTIAAAGDAAERIQVCGLLAQLPGILPILLGMGYRRFSVEPVLIPWLAQTVSVTDTAEAASLAAAVCAAADSDTVRALLALPSRPRSAYAW
jgi:phosphoenolpyruvate-protein kinase (PTS system EI component)